MVGIVVVSHSPQLAEATVNLALEMVQGGSPSIAIAAGAGLGVVGTDATKVADAITEVASDDGVIVFMDLGSAVLSAELALELLTTTAIPDLEVRLSGAPFVEGIIAAVVLAAAGASLDEIDAESRNALAPKQEHLAPANEESKEPADAAPATPTNAPTPAPESPSAAELTADLTLLNPAGLHARPAATFATAAAGFDAQVFVTDVTTGRGPVPAKSLIQILTLGAAQGNHIRLTATGPDAQQAIDALAALVKQGFGELESQSAI